MRVSRARVLFQVFLHVALAGHVLAYYFLDWKAIGAIDFQAFFHYFLGKGLLTAGAIFTLCMFAGALLFGRLFCSWGCHFGATQDLAAWLLKRVLGWRPPLLRTRFLHQSPYLVLLAVFILPLVRHWREGAWGPLAVDLKAVSPWDTLPGWFLSVSTFLACGAGILLFLGTRGFCRFICPYGALFRLTDRVAPLRIRRVAPCGSLCGAGGVHPCTAACPTAIDVHLETSRVGKVTSPDCVRCHLCVEACPGQALALAMGSAPEAAVGGGAFPSLAPRAGGSTFRPLGLPILAAGTNGGSTPPPSQVRAFDLPLVGEVCVLAVAVATYLAADLIYGGHFLVAALALGEGWLAFLFLRAVRGHGEASVWGWPLRRGRRWTFAGITVAGAFFLSAIPIFEAGAFKWLRWAGLRLEREADWQGESEALLDSAMLARLASADGSALEPESRERLKRQAESFRRALLFFPSHLETRRLLLGAFVRLGDRRAVAEAEEIVRLSPRGDRQALALLLGVYRRFGVPLEAPLLEGPRAAEEGKPKLPPLPGDSSRERG